MKIVIKCTKLEFTEAIERYLEKRLGGLEKFLPKVEPASVVCRVEVERLMKGHHKKGDVFRAEANLDILGQVWRAEGFSDDLYAAIDEVYDKLKREIVTHKKKMIDQRVRKARKTSNELPITGY